MATAAALVGVPFSCPLTARNTTRPEMPAHLWRRDPEMTENLGIEGLKALTSQD